MAHPEHVYDLKEQVANHHGHGWQGQAQKCDSEVAAGYELYALLFGDISLRLIAPDRSMALHGTFRIIKYLLKQGPLIQHF
jgi:hypothetical protein